MPKSRIPSPARSQGAITTPRRKKPRGSRSVCSPALSTASGRLTSLIDQFKDNNMQSFALSPLNGRSVLNDNTDIEEPRRKSWWKKLDENSQDIMEVLEDNNKVTDANNVIEELINIEVLSQEKNNFTLDLPESSDNESINSIVLPQRRLFTQKENQAQKKFGQIVGKRETLAKLHKTNTTGMDKTINVGTRELFQNTKRSKPVFPAALLNISPNKTTADKTKENVIMKNIPQVRNIFGNRPANKRKNMFADFIVSESEDEIPDIQPKVFGFQNKLEQRRISSISKGRDASPTSSITTDMELDEWKLLPSSTLVENQIADMLAVQTPIKRARLSKLSEAKESEAGTLQTNTTVDKTKQSNKSVSSKNKSKSLLQVKDKTLDNSRTTRSMLKNISKHEEHKLIKSQSNNASINNDLNVSPVKHVSPINKSKNINKSKTKNSYKLTDNEINKSDVIIGSVDTISKTQTRNKSTSKTLSRTLVSHKSRNEDNMEIDVNSTTSRNTKTEGSENINQNIQEDDDENNFTLEYEHDSIEEEANIHNELEMNQEKQSGNKKYVKEDSVINRSKSNKANLTNKSLHQQQQPDRNVRESEESHHFDINSVEGKVSDHLELKEIQKEIKTNEIMKENKQNLMVAHEGQELNKHNSVEEYKISTDQIQEGQDELTESQEAESDVNESKENKNDTNNSDVKPDTTYASDLNEDTNKSQTVEVNESNENNYEENENEDEANESLEVEGNKSAENYNEENESEEDDRVRPNDEDDKEENEANKSQEVDAGINDSHKVEVNRSPGNKKEVNDSHETKDAAANRYRSIDNNDSEVEKNSVEEAADDSYMNEEVTNQSHEDTGNESQEVEKDIEESQEVESKTEANESDEEANESEVEASESEVEANESDEEANVSEVEANESEVEANVSEVEANESEVEANESEVEANVSEVEANESEVEANESEVEANESEVEANESEVRANESEVDANESDAEVSDSEVESDQQMDDVADQSIASITEMSEHTDVQADEREVDNVENEQSNEAVDESEPNQEEIQLVEQNEGEPSDEEIEESPDVTHDTTGRNRKKELSNKSPEVILHDKTNQMDSFAVKGRNTSVRKTKSIIKNLNIRPSLAPHRDSTGFSDGTKNSSAEGSGWDSHRTTRKTLRQTFGKDFTPRKSLRTLVMEKSAKRQTEHMEIHSETVRFPQANSTELPEVSNRFAEDIEESDHEVSRRTRQTTLENYLLKIKQQNIEKKLKMEEAVRNSLKAPMRDTLSLFKVPTKPAPRRTKPTQSKPKKVIKSVIPFDELPSEVIEDMKYKPPKRFQPTNASWITKRLYKYLENKLEPKYDYKARVRAEKLVETIYYFAKDLRRQDVAPIDAVEVLKHELARLDVVHTHFEFYEFFHEFMPREVRVKVVPDIVNKIPLPRHGVFSDILRGNTVQG